MFSAHNINNNTLSIKNLVLLFFTILLGFASVITLAQISIPSTIDNAWQTIAKISITESGTDTPALIEMSSGGIYIDTTILNPQTNFSGKVLGIDDNGNLIYVYSQNLVVSGAGGGGTGDGLWTGLGNDIWNVNSGSVGIGTNTPTGKLHIVNSGSTDVYIEEQAANMAANLNLKNIARTRALGGDSNPDIFYIGIPNGPIYFSIKPLGNVGIGSGNINPKANLQVVGNFIAGDYSNTVSGTNSSIGGGQLNGITGNYSFIGGGLLNVLTGYQSFIGGGNNNKITNGTQSFIGGGQYSTITNGYQSFIGGGNNNKITNGTESFIGGGDNNTITSSFYSSIGGGGSNNLTGNYSSIGGGLSNNISGNQSFIGGGDQNQLTGDNSFIGGGQINIISGSNFSSIVGGQRNQIYGGVNNFIGGGVGNKIYTAEKATIGGGDSNTITGISDYSVIPGGNSNFISGAKASFAGGYKAQAYTNNTFVRNSDDVSSFQSKKPGTFIINVPMSAGASAAGGVGINTNNPKTALDVSGTIRTRESAGLGTCDMTDTQGAIGFSGAHFYGCDGTGRNQLD